MIPVQLVEKGVSIPNPVMITDPPPLLANLSILVAEEPTRTLPKLCVFQSAEKILSRTTLPVTTKSEAPEVLFDKTAPVRLKFPILVTVFGLSVKFTTTLVPAARVEGASWVSPFRATPIPELDKVNVLTTDFPTATSPKSSESRIYRFRSKDSPTL